MTTQPRLKSKSDKNSERDGDRNYEKRSDKSFDKYSDKPWQWDYLSFRDTLTIQVIEKYSDKEKYREKKITFVEIGVLSGGSLFMWRNYFGKNARIISVVA